MCVLQKLKLLRWVGWTDESQTGSYIQKRSDLYQATVATSEYNFNFKQVLVTPPVNSWNNEAFQISIFQRTPGTHHWVWLGALWRVAWLALNQAGRCLGAQRGPVIITCEWLPVSLCSKTEASETLDEHREAGMLTATQALVCFGLLLITVWHGGKASVSTATSSVKTLSGQLAGRDTYCSLVWLPSGRTWALKTGAHSPSTPAYTRIHDQKVQGEKWWKRHKKKKRINKLALRDKHLRDFITLSGAEQLIKMKSKI